MKGWFFFFFFFRATSEFGNQCPSFHSFFLFLSPLCSPLGEERALSSLSPSLNCCFRGSFLVLSADQQQ